jgi:hypothetical protein
LILTFFPKVLVVRNLTNQGNFLRTNPCLRENYTFSLIFIATYHPEIRYAKNARHNPNDFGHPIEILSTWNIGSHDRGENVDFEIDFSGRFFTLFAKQNSCLLRLWQIFLLELTDYN